MDKQKKIETIIVIYAMEDEAGSFLRATNAKKQTGVLSSKLPTIHYETTIKDTKVHIVCNGKDKDFGVDLIGKLGATMVTMECISKLNPDLILNAGTSGAFEFPEARVNEVFLATDNVYINDRRTSMIGYDEYITGRVPCLKASKLQKDLNLPGAIVSSSDSMDLVTEDIKMIRTQKAQLLDMEIGIIAWVARQYEVPLLALKGVSNHLYGTGKAHVAEFYENLGDTSTYVSETLLKVIEYINGKSIQDLE